MAKKPIAQAGRAELTSFLTTDYAAITRGRSIRRSEYEKGTTSAGWVPANMSLTPFDLIADPNPWGSRGDLRLVADPQARFRAWPEGAATPLDMVMCDITELDGEPWTCCPRTFLKAALADFKFETGCDVIASFEQEFQILDAGWPPAPAFSLQAMRRADPFGPELMAALEQAGLTPEVFIPEYGRDQFEVTIAPAPGLAAADRAIVVREIVRELAGLKGWRATFAPKTAVEGVGNGVHVHLSFRGRNGKPTAFDPQQPSGVSGLAGAFAAGVLEHLPALTALTAPSPVSYLRLKPHNWSASYTWFGERDRESSLRICSGRGAASYNLEYRAADATANPYLVLGAIIRSGLEGIHAKSKTPPIFAGDPATLSEAERTRLDLHRLPSSLPEALAAFTGDKVVRGWLSAPAYETYTGMKAAELKLVHGLEGDALCRRYAEVY